MFLEGKKRLVGLFEPVHRRIRAEFNGEIIADSTNVMMLRESPFELVYYIPKADVETVYLLPEDYTTTDDERGEAIYWTLNMDDNTVEHAAWSYHEQIDGLPDLRDYIAFRWDAIDAWYEEDEEIHGHPRDPYHRVDIRRSTRPVRVEVDGETVAETENALFVFETGVRPRYYIPPGDVQQDYLDSTDTTTRCPYKGLASYWSVTVDGTTHADIVWAYPEPEPDNVKIANYFCFYNEKDPVTIYVDGVPEQQPAELQGSVTAS